MSGDFEDKDHTEFIRLSDDEDDETSGPVVSRAAFQLNSFGMVQSVQDGTPGFVSDDYLRSIVAETNLTATELCMAGLWQRGEGGYNILDPMLEQVAEFNERMDRASAECERLGHQWEIEGRHEYCGRCLKPRHSLPPPPDA